jgi:hypothetical protein
MPTIRIQPDPVLTKFYGLFDRRTDSKTLLLVDAVAECYQAGTMPEPIKRALEALTK